jgi:hypothetical protein
MRTWREDIVVRVALYKEVREFRSDSDCAVRIELSDTGHTSNSSLCERNALPGVCVRASGLCGVESLYLFSFVECWVLDPVAL